MKLKIFLINLGLISFSVYLPLSFYSFYSLINDKSRKINFQQNNLRISAVKNGYKPIFYPDKVLKNHKIINYYPVGSLPFTNTYDCDEGYGLIKYKTDRLGLRNKDQNWLKVNQEPNIFMIGDSFGHGSCVNDHETIAGVLEKLNKKNVLNFSSPANSAQEYKALLKLLVEPILQNSKLQNTVIIFFYPNDYVEFNYKKEAILKTTSPIINFEDDKQELIISKKYIKNHINFLNDNYPQSSEKIINEIKNNNKTKISRFKNSNIFYTFSLLPVRRSMRLFIEDLSNRKLNKNKFLASYKTIDKLSKICKNLCKPIITYLPPSNYWTRYYHSDLYKSELEKTAEKFGILFLDGEKVIDRNNLNNYSPVGDHFSIKGYRKISEFINNFSL